MAPCYGICIASSAVDVFLPNEETCGQFHIDSLFTVWLINQYHMQTSCQALILTPGDHGANVLHSNPGTKMQTIDINADLGESFGPWVMGNDAAMMDIVSSANIAWGNF